MRFILLVVRKDMSDIQSQKLKFKTLVEKNIQRLVSRNIREHVVDFVVLYVRKNKIAVDGELLNQLLQIVQQGIDDGYYRNIDGVMGNMDKTIEEFIEETNPLASTGLSNQKDSSNPKAS